jgi:hypothetical protein
MRSIDERLAEAQVKLAKQIEKNLKLQKKLAATKVIQPVVVPHVTQPSFELLSDEQFVQTLLFNLQNIHRKELVEWIVREYSKNHSLTNIHREKGTAVLYGSHSIIPSFRPTFLTYLTNGTKQQQQPPVVTKRKVGRPCKQAPSSKAPYSHASLLAMVKECLKKRFKVMTITAQQNGVACCTEAEYLRWALDAGFLSMWQNWLTHRGEKKANSRIPIVKRYNPKGDYVPSNLVLETQADNCRKKSATALALAWAVRHSKAAVTVTPLTAEEVFKSYQDEAKGE